MVLTAAQLMFREDTRTPLSVATGAEVGGIIIRAVIGGFLSVRFACSPGTVTPPDPGTVTFIDPAPSFATTGTCLSVPGISIDDQTVTEGFAATFLVSLFGCGAGSELVTVDFATADGTALAPGDYTPTSGTLTFAPGVTSQTVTVQTIADDLLVEANETFFVNLSNATRPVEIFDSQGAGTIVTNQAEQPPTANAGPDQTVSEGALATLDGTGSSDPEGEALTYAWTAPAEITLSDPTSATPTFTAPDVDVPTQWTFTLEVCDEANPASLCATDTVVVTVQGEPIEHPPVANAGPDQTVLPGTTVNLDGTASFDPAGQPLTYMWTAAAGITLSDPTSPTPTFTAPDVATTTPFALTLEVCDVVSLCNTDTVVVTVVGRAILDAAGIVFVNGPVSSTKTSKSFVFKVTNVGTSPITINESDITSSVDVNGTPTGSVTVSPFTKTLNPGASTRVKLVWSYAAGALATGDAVVFHGCANVAGDVDTTNDCDSASATAK